MLMIRKMVLCVVLLGVVLVLSGCGSESDLKEEDMVKVKQDCVCDVPPVK